MSGRHSGAREKQTLLAERPAPAGRQGRRQGAQPERAVPVGRRGRRQAARQRVSRRRWGVGGAALIVVIAVAVTIAVLAPPHAGRAPQRAALATAQRTVLLGYGPPGQPAQSAAVLGAVPALGDDAAAGPSGALLLIPGSLIDPGRGGTVGGAFAVPDPQEFPASVGSLLGIRIDETWRLTPSGLTALVDRVGGIGVEVDVPVPDVGLAVGSQRVNGHQAAAYVSYAAQGDSDLLRADRLRRVFNGLLAAFSAQPGGLANSLGSLGAASDVSSGAAGFSPAAARADLAAIVVAAARSDVAGHEQIVPTIPGTPSGYALDQGAAAMLIGQLFAGARQSVAAGTRVEVVNDAGTPDLAASAGTRLRAARLVLIKAVNDQPFGQHPRSEVLVFDAAPTSLAFGHRVAEALGIPAAPVVVSNQVSVVTDAVAVLGGDYQP